MTEPKKPKKKLTKSQRIVGGIFVLALVIWAFHSSVSPTPNKAEQARSAIAQFNSVDNEYESNYNQFSAVVNGLINGTTDSTTAYSEVKSLKEGILKTYSDTVAMNVSSDFKDDQESIELATSYLRSSADEFAQYLNDQQVKYMSEATDDLKQSQQEYQMQVSQVSKTAVADGYKS